MFGPFSILITLLGEEGAGLCAYVHLFVSYAKLICVTFSLPPGVRAWMRLLLVVLPGHFSLPFCLEIPRYYIPNEIKVTSQICVK